MAQPYTIAVPQSSLEILHKKLEATTFPDELDGSAWDYGVPLTEVKRLVARWQDGFDWRAYEAKLNTLPNFTTSIDVEGFGPLEVHFVHQRSGVDGAIPLLFCHGWPGSFIEVEKLLPLLKGGDGAPAFDIVAPSLPNFGFSQGISKKGFGLAQYAEVCHKLMLQLGYNEYVTQGGDWGMMITRIMGLRFPSHVKATHINMVRADRPRFSSTPLAALQHAITRYTPFDRAGFERAKWFLDVSSGYRKLQSTKPQTLGYSLADSPAGLLAWIYEKLVEWSDSYAWTDDEVLGWVSIYWFSRAGPAASLRIYYEATHDSPEFHRQRINSWIPGVKLGLAFFPRELGWVPRTWARTMGPVVHESQWEKGGHFAAHERPDAIAQDLAKMFGRGGVCFGVVKGRDGY